MPIFRVFKQLSAEELIADVMNNFQFERVHHTMELLKWTWGGIDGESGAVPDIAELKRKAELLLIEVCTRPGGGGISSGGFVAAADAISVSLYFSIGDWTSTNLRLEDFHSGEFPKPE